MRRLTSLLFPALVLCGVLAIYVPSWNYELVFDDLRLTEDVIFGVYGNLLSFKQRMLSYGSFVWVNDWFGDGWGKQRLVNILLHLGTAGALYLLVHALLTHTRFPEDFEAEGHFAASRQAAAQVAAGLFALSPMAVYAVSYLVQRSILMATLFSVLACWLFVQGLVARKPLWHGLAFASYVLAVLSKEHALLTAAMAVPLFIHIRRPPWRVVAAVAGGAGLLLLLSAAVFYGIYGALVGRIFDPRSVDLAQQLEQLRPGVTQHIYPLSILNEARLFFAYGFLWAVPVVQWMSIDLRPAFPLSFSSFPQWLGALGYVALLAFAIWAVLRRRGVLSLVGVALLFPLLYFVTEFATVWLQDPFVLYRSYLWATGVVLLVATLLTGFKPRTIYMLGVVLACVWGMLAFERVSSFQDRATVWQDAADKIDLQAPANAVGRWRPFLNLGAQQLEQGDNAAAIASFSRAVSLGSLHGSAQFNIGTALQNQRKYAEAVAAFDEAQRQGFDDLSLYYQRGEAEFTLGQFDRAYQNFSTGLAKSAEGVTGAEMKRMLQAMQLRKAEAAVGSQRYPEAIREFTELLTISPGSARLAVGLGSAYTGIGDTQKALAVLNPLIARRPSPMAFYSRAMAYHTAGQTAAALQDLDKAIALDPQNARYQQVRGIVAAGKR